MSKFKKIIAFFVSLIMVFAFFTNITLAKESDFVDIETAKKVAIAHICSVMQTDESKWEKGLKIFKTTTMYDFDKEPSAYLFELMNKNDEECGYVVIGANKTSYPIIEFSFSSTPFIYKAVNEIENSRKNKDNNKELKKVNFYYLKGLNYFAQLQYNDNEDETFNILTNNYTKINKQSINNAYKNLKNQFKARDEHCKKLWNGWMQHLENTKGSNPPSSDDYPIDNPDNYESGYHNTTWYTIAWEKPSDYFVMNDFRYIDGTQYRNHCAPTAGTNILYYWYNQDSSKYSSLKYNNKWNNTFVEMHKQMGTTNEDGTSNNALVSAYEAYFSDRNLSCNATFYSDVSWSKIKSEIDNKRPSHICLHGAPRDYYYGHHSVVGFGYAIFQYRFADIIPTSYSNYIQILDGWAAADRYVHYDTGFNSINMVKVVPN